MSEAKTEYLPALDGLRAVSILLVLVSHAWLGDVVPGGLGVTIFFFISGLIITRLFIKELDTTRRISVGAFYIRRIFRITPALLVYVAVSMLVFVSFGGRPRVVEILSVLLYFANYYGIFVGFTGVPVPSPFAHIWSLMVEEHYYMVFPFLFMLDIKNWRRLCAVLVALLVLVLAWRLVLVLGYGLESLPESRTYKATDTRFDSILYGALYSILIRYVPTLRDWLSKHAAFWFGVGLMLLSLAIKIPEFRESLRYSLQGVALFMMCTRLVFEAGLFKSALASPVMVYIGKISYSMYLYHWLAYCVVTYFFVHEAWIVRASSMIVGTFVVAHFSYRYVEQPCLRARRIWFS